MDYKTFSLTLAKQAGILIRDNFTLGMKKEWKDNATPLTVTDVTINNLACDAVKATFPDHGFLGEEVGSFNQKAEYVWLCDPIDGTFPFSHGIPTCVFGLALVRDGKPILGLVFDPFMDRMFFAEKGTGAFLNDKKITVSDMKDFNHSMIGLVMWRTADYDFSALVNPFMKTGAHFINLGCTMYMSMLVASGEFIAAVWPGSTPWDIAPIKIIVEEAGGTVTNIFGDEQRYDQDIKGGIVTNGHVHEEMIKMIKKHYIP